MRRSLTEPPRLEALRTELPSPVTEAGDARTGKNYGKIEAGLIRKDACSFTVPDTRRLSYLSLQFPRPSQVCAFLVDSLECGKFTRSVTN